MKLSTTYYTLLEAVTVPVGKVLNPDTFPQAPQVMTVEYCGHVDKTTIGDSISYSLHLPYGYITLDDGHNVTSLNYFRCDHLGNNVAVWSATADSTTQRTFYYPSGLPMAVSTGQSAQPYKYNGKEFVEMHGYDVYDYGFRGYYATIARFTSIDPLCEQTPWQSPYCYASNNFTGEIDWMGLFRIAPSTCHWIAVDNNGVVVGVDMTSADIGVYLVDEDWDETYEGLANYWKIGRQIPGIVYIKNGIFDFFLEGGGLFSAEFRSAMAYDGYTYQFGFYKEISSTNTVDLISDIVDYSSMILGIGADAKCNSLYWIGKNGQLYVRNQIHMPGGYAYSYKIAQQTVRPIKTLTRELAGIGLSFEILDVAVTGNVKPSNVINMAMAGLALTGCCTWIPIVYSLTDMAVLVATGESLSEKIDKLR